MNKWSLKCYIDGIFNSKLNYCLPVFGNVLRLDSYKETSTRYISYTTADNNELQILQNKVHRILLNADRNTSTKELCERADNLSVQQMIAHSTLTTAFNSSVPPEFAFESTWK